MYLEMSSRDLYAGEYLSMSCYETKTKVSAERRAWNGERGTVSAER